MASKSSLHKAKSFCIIALKLQIRNKRINMQIYKHKLPTQNDSNDIKSINITTLIDKLKADISAQTSDMSSHSIYIEVFGMIQGVGFRPFVAALAHALNINGSVYNQSNNATIILSLDSNIKSILTFFITLILACGHNIDKLKIEYKDIMQKANILLSKLHTPKQAFIKSLHYTFKKERIYTKGFTILSSIANTQNGLDAYIPLDTKICKSCLKDLYDKQSRFYHYPFTSCVNCGARYSILYKLPYDRSHTSMNDMKLCVACNSDYTDLHNRRFHTEPISCNLCPIKISFYSIQATGKATGKKDSIIQSKTCYDTKAIKSLANALVNNKIVLFKGLGGFAYIANARNTKSLQCIRSIKARKHKPFVVMATLPTLRKIALLTPNIESLLTSKESPIVLAPKNVDYNLSDEVSNLHSIGVMIPYTAMLVLLFSYLPSDFAIIYTSANNKGDIIATSLNDLGLDLIMQHTKELFILDYDREIINRVDDSITLGIEWQEDSIIKQDSMQAINTNRIESFAVNARYMRLSRGFAPLHLTSNIFNLNLLGIAFGAMQKSSLAFGKEKHIVVSPYMGDLFTLKNIENFRKNLDYFISIYGKPEVLIADKHPQYTSTNIAKEIALQSNIPLFHATHHHAHFNALLLEAGEKQGVGVIFDGSGLGDDGTLWGGEFFVGDFTQVKRVLNFKPFMLLGGEQHLRDSKRLAYSYALCNNIYSLQSFIESTYSNQEYKILKQLYEAKINSPLCSSVGRLFDIAGFILGLHSLDYEAQSGEIIASKALNNAYKILSHKNSLSYDFLIQTFMNIPFKPYPFNIDKNQIDISECFVSMLNDIYDSKNKCEIALCFIDTLAYCILESLRIIGADYALFGGGVFANYALCMRTQKLLSKHNIKAFFPQLPCNDYSISIGQLAYLQHLI